MGFWSNLGSELTIKAGESFIYKRGFNDGQNGEPRQIWRYDTEEARSLYNRGYEDGRDVARHGA